MSEDVRAEVQEQFRRRHVHFFYLGFTQRMNKPHWRALEQDTGLLKRRIYDDAGTPWEGLNTLLQMDLVRVAQNWSTIALVNSDGTAPAWPVAITEQEAQETAALAEALLEVDSDLERINKLIGIAPDGWTSHEMYENVKKTASLLKEEGLSAVSDDPWLQEMTEKHWPFDDYDENE